MREYFTLHRSVFPSYLTIESGRIASILTSNTLNTGNHGSISRFWHEGSSDGHGSLIETHQTHKKSNRSEVCKVRRNNSGFKSDTFLFSWLHQHAVDYLSTHLGILQEFCAVPILHPSSSPS